MVSNNCAKCVKIYGPAGEGDLPQEVKTYDLVLEAMGSTCYCYRIEGNGEYAGHRLKEFCTSCSERDENGAVKINESSPQYLAFMNMSEPAVLLAGSYDHAQATFFEKPVLYDTSLGKCYLYQKVAGKMVSDFMAEKRLMWKEHLCQVLQVMVFVLNDLQRIHEANMVHLDMKRENTFMLFVDNEKDFRCRSIDLGSCMKFPSEQGWKDLAQKEFASTKRVYLGEDIKAAKKFLENHDDDEKKKNILFWLDLKACSFMMFELLFEGNRLRLDRPIYVCEALKNFFCKQAETSENPIHYLDIYARLCAIVDRSFRCPYGKKEATFYPLSEFRLDLYRLLAILGDDKLTPDEKEEKDAVNRDKLIHDNISAYCTELLKNREKNQEWSFGDVLIDYEDFINNPNTKPEEYSVAGYYKHLLIQYL